MQHLSLDNPKHFQFWDYNGGEIGCRFVCTDNAVDCTSLGARLNSPQSLIKLVLAVDALKRNINKPLNTLDIGYMPYARQDKLHADGDGLSVQPIAGIIDNLGFKKVCILDPHSDVTLPCFTKTKAVISDGSHWFHKWYTSSSRRNCVMVIPDAGAQKRVATWAKRVGIPYLVQAIKDRDPVTGQINSITIGDVDHIIWDKIDNIIVADDICDRGGTFMGIAEALRLKGIDIKDRLHLYVSHGIFPGDSIDVLRTKFSSIATNNTCRDFDLRVQEEKGLFVQLYHT